MVTSLDCIVATSCWAVGIKDAQHGIGSPFAAHWNGRAWVLSAAPPLKGQLFSVSCTAPSSCFAAGILLGTGLLFHLSGSAWREIPLTQHAAFAALACSSASTCVAGGSLTARWKGRVWALGDAASMPGDSAGANIASIACPARTDCIAVGTTGEQASSTRSPTSSRGRASFAGL
ncbi:MAG: hypothetical protein M0004_11605 [Actinomycetota bacterium]|nr:hypothetical protein [Actinomycetota bacterium]